MFGILRNHRTLLIFLHCWVHFLFLPKWSAKARMLIYLSGSTSTSPRNKSVSTQNKTPTPHDLAMLALTSPPISFHLLSSGHTSLDSGPQVGQDSLLLRAFAPQSLLPQAHFPAFLQLAPSHHVGLSSASSDLSILFHTPQYLSIGIYFPDVFSSLHLSISEIIFN